MSPRKRSFFKMYFVVVGQILGQKKRCSHPPGTSYPQNYTRKGCWEVGLFPKETVSSVMRKQSRVSINTSTLSTWNHRIGEVEGADRSHQQSQRIPKDLTQSNSAKMKTLTLAVAVAVVLAFIWMQESAATFHGVRTWLWLISFACWTWMSRQNSEIWLFHKQAQQPEEAVSNEDPAADPQETPVDSWMVGSVTWLKSIMMMNQICVERTKRTNMFFLCRRYNTSHVSCLSMQMPSNRQKRGMKCKFCCNCCNMNGCGMCCDFWGIPAPTAMKCPFSSGYCLEEVLPLWIIIKEEITHKKYWWRFWIFSLVL